MSGYALFFDVQYKLYQSDNTKGVSKDQLKTAVTKSYITNDQYKTITGEDYSADHSDMKTTAGA
ncbi:XkdX family protein [Caproiciproducens sp. NJN-50]|uniref:XkdX family protein n=1 Tax=Acutalibacteraceae TaxID=3082771 RepID=UPI000FFE1AA1|nr:MULTISPECIES: XkdX family protein [Acutalibacteraceae]QAT48733.1 XkdX family protein [Caproiciproducens sp. NJN-50]